MPTDRDLDPQALRAAKRAQFEQHKARPGGPSPLILVVGLLVVVAVIGGAFLIISRPAAGSAAEPPAAADQAPAATVLDEENLLVKAATEGHAPYPLIQAKDGAVRLPLSTFDDFKAHYYTYMHDGRPIEFFVLKSGDGVVRAAFNACDVCFQARLGYRQEGDSMVCNNCGSRFPSDQINVVRGGCNPSPLTRNVEGDNLVIEVEDIVSGLDYF